MLLEETDGYWMGALGERTIKRTHGFHYWRSKGITGKQQKTRSVQGSRMWGRWQSWCKNGHGVNKKVQKWTKQLVKQNLNNEHLVLAIITWVVPMASYIVDICKLGKEMRKAYTK